MQDPHAAKRGSDLNDDSNLDELSGDAEQDEGIDMKEPNAGDLEDKDDERH